MAFTAIPNSSIDADSPLTETLMTYFRDNDDYLKGLFHISTGHDHAGGTDSGAPIAQSSLQDYAAGDSPFAANLDLVQHTGSTYTKYKEIAIARDGVIRVKFDLQEDNSVAGQAAGRIYRNGGAVGTEQTVDFSGFTTFSEDISGWSEGDLLQLYIKQTNGDDVSAKNLILYSTVTVNEANMLI